MTPTPPPEPPADFARPRPARRAWSWALLALIAVNAVAGLYRVHARQDPHMDDGVQGLINAYARVVASVPVDSHLALLSYEPDAGLTARMQLIAQHGLAPRILEAHLDWANHLVTSPHAPEDVGADPRLAGYELVARFGAGIRLYRRTP